MPEVILSDYFYGAESEEFIYFKIPRLLITDQKFKHISTDAKLLYGMLLDRMGLSAKNSWYDDFGRVCIYYTVDEIKLSPKSRTIIGCHYENKDGFAKGSSGADFFKG